MIPITLKDTKYMLFQEQTPRRGKTAVVQVINKRSQGLLGMIHWHPAWRQYCFFPEPNCVFNDSCLQEIIAFMGELRKAL